ncbi:MAG: pyridoxamine 5'-phosphate oxidase [Bdellovibrionaceae bacterium]|nr:pyridoxamine 5'-phosphate oxidase [Pseudobdellovibrionaceae bacterium]
METENITENILEVKNPLELAKSWLEVAQNTAAMTFPNSMCIATVDSHGQASTRIVLLKELTEQGFVFFTNYQSRKGQDLEHDSRISANFYWDKLFRQIHIVGKVTKVKREDSVKYWKTRPRESQISQYVSRQSQVAESREMMDNLYNQAEENWAGKEIPCPEHWGGYLITPIEMEFWIGREHRFHDRFQFKKYKQDTWLAQRLFP